MILTVKNSRKRNNVELEIETQNNGMLELYTNCLTIYVYII